MNGFIIVPATAVIVAAFVYRYAKWPYNVLKRLGIPIDKDGKYFIGHILKQVNYDHIGVFDLELFQIHGDTFGLVEFDTPVIVTKDPELLKEVIFNCSQSFTGRRRLYLRKWMKHSLLDIEGYEWKRTRSMLTPFFSSGKLKNNLPLVRKCAKALVENLRVTQEKQRSVDVQPNCGAFALDVICSTAFGLQVDSQSNPNDAFLVMMKKIQNINFDTFLMLLVYTFPFLSPVVESFGVSMFPKGYLSFFESFARQLIEERQADAGDKKRSDFVDAMVKAHLEDLEKKGDGEKKGLTNDEILAQTLLFLLAGYDTTSKSLSFFLHCLALHQDEQEKVVSEIRNEIGDEDLTYDNMHRLEYLEMCFSESLRMYPPVFRFDRRATADVKVGEMTIQKGTCVVAPVWALHHDPITWPEPDKFNPERFSKEATSKRSQCMFMPFGAGSRNCIGMRMAQMTVKTAVIEILRNFRIVATEKTENPIQLKKYVLFIQAENGIHIGFEKR